MIKRTIEISQQAVKLSCKLDQLIVKPYDAPPEHASSIPGEDIGVLLIDHPQTTMTQGALELLARHNAVAVVCGRDHLPMSLLLPISSNVEQVHRLHEQIAASKPTLKRLWQQVVRTKILHQASVLAPDEPARKQLERMAGEVKSGDTQNHEAQAAKAYWAAWRSGWAEDFRRDPDGRDEINGMLNYGYSAMRAAVARAIVVAGLHPALGLHHRHRANAFCLADDLVEPLRPLVDQCVRRLARGGRRGLEQPEKAELLNLLVHPVNIGDDTGPLMVALHRVTASLIRCLRKEDTELALPTWNTDRT